MTQNFEREREPSPFSRSLFLTGPTAGGKTALGVELARRLGAEIVSLDSMAIYRKMDVGTAKPTLEERGGIPHHMLDVVEPSEEFSTAEYLRQAGKVVRGIESRGKVALFVGGTPLYLKTALFGVFEAPGADREYREELAELERREGPGTLWSKLREVDPVACERIHANDAKRLIRALEVYRATGRPISELQTQFDAPPLANPRRAKILTWERERIYARIDARVDQMMAQGFDEEVRELFEGEPKPGPTASKAVGYRELRAAQLGEISRDEAIETTKRLTRNFAKRQETWFRSLSARGAERVEVGEKTREALLDELERAFGEFLERNESL